MPASNGKRKSGKKPTKKSNGIDLNNPDIQRALQILSGAGVDTLDGEGPVERYRPLAWGEPEAALVDLAVPSGGVCQVRTVGVQGLVKVGILQHIDSLSSLVSEEYIVPNGEGLPEIDAKRLADNEEQVMSVFDVVNKVVCHVVVQPTIEPVPRVNADDELVEPGTIDYDLATPVDSASPLREVGVIYVDTVPEEDQMFIFQHVMGGTSDLERFREQAEELLGGLDIGPAVEMPSV